MSSSNNIAQITSEPDPSIKTPVEQKFSFWYRISYDTLINQQPGKT